MNNINLSLVKSWHKELLTSDDSITFEQLYDKWNSEANLPPIEEVCDAINYMNIKWDCFYNYFDSVLN